MAQKRDTKFHIGGTPISAGLDLSAGRNMIDETQLWELEGLYANEDKALVKRPSFAPWATQLVEPSHADTTNNEIISEILYIHDDTWGEASVTGESIGASYDNGVAILSGWETSAAGSGSASIERTLVGEEAFNVHASYDDSMSASFIIKVKNAPTGEFIKFQVAVGLNTMKEFIIDSTGLSHKTGASTYSLITGTDTIVDGEAHRVDIMWYQNTLMAINVDGTWATLIPSTYVENTSDYFAKIIVTSDDTLDAVPYTVSVSSFMIRDAANFTPSIEDVFDVVPVVDMQTIREIKAASFADTNNLVVATSGHLWMDYGLREMWTPLAKLGRDKTRFSKFRGNTIACNYSDSVRKTEVYEHVDDGLQVLSDAPNLRFTTEFTSRMWGAGDADHPLRLYYSGDRQSNTWYNPDDPDVLDTEDAQREAGFLEFQGSDKARIRLIYGDFFGMLLVATDEDVWAVSGTSPSDYGVKRLSGALNAAGDLCGVDVFNDYWLIGKNGVSSVQATDKFGDVEGKKLSLLARELFNTDNASGRMLDPGTMYKSKMVYYPKFSTMIIYAEEDGTEEPGVMYAMHSETGKWSGPWREQCTALRIVTLAHPVKDMVAIGTEDGYVKYMTQHVSNSDTVRMASALITGRSHDQKLESMKKVWGHLRLKIVPTGNWDITFRWKVEDEEWKTVTKKLCLPDHPLVGTDKTGTALAKSDVQPMILEIPLNVRGLSLKYEIETTAPWFKATRWELDFSVSGYERD